MKKTICLLSIFLIILFLGAGCGTIMGKRYSTIKIDAAPAANYLVVNERSEKVAEGHTPGKIKLKAADSETHIAAKYYVVFNAPGQATQVTVVDSAYTKWATIGDGVLGGLTGFFPVFIYAGIDYEAGAMFRLEDVCVQMAPAQFSNQVRPDLLSR